MSHAIFIQGTTKSEIRKPEKDHGLAAKLTPEKLSRVLKKDIKWLSGLMKKLKSTSTIGPLNILDNMLVIQQGGILKFLGDSLVFLERQSSNPMRLKILEDLLNYQRTKRRN